MTQVETGFEWYRDLVAGDERRSSKRRWSTSLMGPEEVTEAKNKRTYIIFSGGACNIRDEHGDLIRSTGRDWINSELSRLGIVFFDPQIHPESHERDYDYEKDGPVEKVALEYSLNDLIEIRHDTAGPVSALELLRQINEKDQRVRNRRVILIEGLRQKGRLEFRPKGVADGNATESARRAHYKEYIKNANQMRRELIEMLRADGYLWGKGNWGGTFRVFQDQVAPNDAEKSIFMELEHLGDKQVTLIKITNEKAHFADLLRAMKLVREGNRVWIHFIGSSNDGKGNPTVVFPDYPEVQTAKGNVEHTGRALALMGQYVEEVDAMRALLVEYLQQETDTQIVSTPREALAALLKNKEQQEDEIRIEQARLIGLAALLSNQPASTSTRFPL